MWPFSKPNPGPPPTTEEMLNAGLGLAMVFGSHWLAPIQPRLAQAYPQLTPKELDEFDATCRATMTAGHSFAYKLLEETGQNNTTLSAQLLTESLTSFILAEHPWVNKENLSRLASQGIYYACKDGLDRFSA